MEAIHNLLKERLERAQDDAEQSALSPERVTLATLDYERALSLEALFKDLRGDLLAEYIRLSSAGRIELATTTATQASLTDLMSSADSIRFQLKVAAQAFEHHFGQGPQGLILDGSGYMPSFDSVIAEAGFRYVIVSEDAFRGASSELQGGRYAAIHSPGTGVAALMADSGFQRWRMSGKERPDVWYREGKQLACLQNTGAALWTSSRRTSDPLVRPRYQPHRVKEAVTAHGEGWWCTQRIRLEKAAKKLGATACLVGVISAESLTRDWFEGPDFLCAVGTLAGRDASVSLVAISHHLDRVPKNQIARLGPALSKSRAPLVLPYLLPCLEKAADRVKAVSTWYQEGLQDEATAGALREMIRALLSIHGALSTDCHLNADTIRVRAQFIEELFGQISRTRQDAVRTTATLKDEPPHIPWSAWLDVPRLFSR